TGATARCIVARTWNRNFGELPAVRGILVLRADCGLVFVVACREDENTRRSSGSIRACCAAIGGVVSGDCGVGGPLQLPADGECAHAAACAEHTDLSLRSPVFVAGAAAGAPLSQPAVRGFLQWLGA